MRTVCILTGLVFGWVASAAPGDSRGPDEAEIAAQTCAAELPRWQLTADGIVLDRPTAPALRWSNPAAGRVYGNTYVWLYQGRPAAASSLYRYFEPYKSFDGELVALAGPKLVAKRNEKVMWEPAGQWKWNALPGAVPAATSTERSVQMRGLAEEFKVELLDTRNIPKGDDQSPRLLAKPLYRYDAVRTKTLDGALFAFVLGTDPELLLLLECDTAATVPEWRFGIGRMNRDAFRVQRKGEKVWEAPALKGDDLAAPYRLIYIGLKG